MKIPTNPKLIPFDFNYAKLLVREYAELTLKYTKNHAEPNQENFHVKIIGPESMRKILTNYLISNLFLKHIANFKNFKTIIPYPEFTIQNYDQPRSSLSYFYNRGLIDESYGVIENYLRAIGSWIFNDYSYIRGKKFYQVRKDILLYLNLENYNPLFDIFDRIKNAIHNDGIHTAHKNKKLEIIQYKFNFYFVRHFPVNYISHNYLFFILAEISFLFEDILNHKWIKSRNFYDKDMPHF